MNFQHWFVTWNTRSSRDIHRYIKEYNFIFLQEITRKELEKEAYKLNNSNRKIFYNCIHDDRGNGLITNLHIVKQEIGSLDVGYGTEDDTYIYVTVDLTKTDSQDRSNHLKIFCTQLDKNNEKTRLEQLQSVQPILDECELIMGNLNCLSFADYSLVEIDIINKRRSKNDQDAASNEVIKFIENFGFCHRPYIKPTSTQKTRIDYIMIKKNKNIFCTGEEIIIPKSKTNNNSKHYLVAFLIHKKGRRFLL